MAVFSEERISSWADFKVRIAELEAARAGSHPFHDTWFRGQADANWKLMTTLERHNHHNIPMIDYFRAILKTKPALESMSGQRWPDDDFRSVEKFTATYESPSFGKLPMIGLLTHLRHHGFPSPLLDWSASPFVAAYFAFARPAGAEVAIFCFTEQLTSGKFYSSSRPQIVVAGPDITTHHRHFRQRSNYTVAMSFLNQWYFSPHSDVFESVEDQNQDRLIKLVLPSTLRMEVLSELDRYNLNAYSLFGSEDSLMETLAFRVLDKN